MTKEKLVLDVKPAQLSAYGNLLVGFFDKIYLVNKRVEDGKEKTDEQVRLYIHIENSDDKNSIVERRAGERRLMDELGEFVYRPEIELYKRAYDKYLAVKANVAPDYKSELEAAQKLISELQAKEHKAEDISSKENKEPIVSKKGRKKEEFAE